MEHAKLVSQVVFRHIITRKIGAVARMDLGRRQMDDERRPAGKQLHEVGMALDALSVDELKERILILGSEIDRLKKEIEKKDATRSVAESAFNLK